MSTISDEFHSGPPSSSSAPGLDAPAVAPPSEEAGTANLDKVRDILFGAHMRDYDRRFARLEERLVKETTDLNDEVRRRLAALEDFVKKEAESLAQRITSECEARSEDTLRLSRELQDTAVGLQRRAGTLDDQLGRVQRELRQQILEQYQRLTDEMRGKIEDVLTRISQESTNLRADKADRATIASLLTEMAMRLTNDLTVPGFDLPRNG